MKPSRVLVVEDDELIATDLQCRLKRLGYEVSGWTSSGEAAVAASRRLRPDVVLMDICLDGPMDGVQAACQLRDEQVPIIFLTAHTGPNSRLRAGTANPHAFLGKPFDESSLRAALESIPRA